MGIQIRYGGLGDLPQILELTEELHQLHHQNRPDLYKPFDREATARYFQLSAEDPDHIYLLAEEDGQALGYAHIIIRERKGSSVMTDRCTFLIEEIGVREGYRRRGIGRALLTEVQCLAGIKGADAIELCVWAFNEDAAAFYRKAGFRVQRSILELTADTPQEAKIE